jgi:quinol monooxygenase YgiN
MVQLALLAWLQAKPGMEQELANFLKSALPLAEAEPGTVTWYAWQIDDSTFGIFDTFAAEEGREAHLNGKIAAALMENADRLLAKPPLIEKLTILAAKGDK